MSNQSTDYGYSIGGQLPSSATSSIPAVFIKLWEDQRIGRFDGPFDGFVISPTTNAQDHNQTTWMVIWDGTFPEIPHQNDPRAYGEWCRNPSACANKGYCPLDPSCDN